MTGKKSRISCLSIFGALIVLFFLFASAGIVFLYLAVNQLHTEIGPPSPDVSKFTAYRLSLRMLRSTEDLRREFHTHLDPAFLEINSGDSPSQICAKIVQITEMSNCGLFVDYLVYKGLDREILAGRFSIPNNTNMTALAELITDPLAVTVHFTILPGWRVEEIAQALQSSGLLTDTDTLVDYVHQNKMEGYLFPAEYELTRDIAPEEIAQVFVDRFHNTLRKDTLMAIVDQDLELWEAVTLASIVQREAVHKDEMPLIASVFLNRLRLPMKLDADPTVQYALGFEDNSWWKSPLSLSDLQVDSLYNTYIYPGLPPTAISNPGLGALQAVAYPEKSDYLFFRNACDGSGYHVFARDFNEHLLNECR